MNMAATILHRIRRHRSLQTHRITALPIAILEPHSACNCRCAMCDIWKGNAHLKQLQKEDISALLCSLHKLGTQQVVLSGGEALLHPQFFDFCRMIQAEGIKITLLSTGLTLEKQATKLIRAVDEIIVSLDGNETIHNRIRNIPDAFQKLQSGVLALKTLNPHFPVSARTVIHQMNFRCWTDIIANARQMQLDHISFLPADLSSEAFNRSQPWDPNRQSEIAIPAEELDELEAQIEKIIHRFTGEIATGFIAESAGKLQKIGQYYRAVQGQCDFPYKKCNAPWVSVVVEPDGKVRPCFFHPASGNIHEQELEQIINQPSQVEFRKTLDTVQNTICERCVCSLYLSPGTKLI